MKKYVKIDFEVGSKILDSSYYDQKLYAIYDKVSHKYLVPCFALNDSEAIRMLLPSALTFPFKDIELRRFDVFEIGKSKFTVISWSTYVLPDTPEENLKAAGLTQEQINNVMKSVQARKVSTDENGQTIVESTK